MAKGIWLLALAASLGGQVDHSAGAYHASGSGGNPGFFLGHFDLAPALDDCADFGAGRIYRGGYPLVGASAANEDFLQTLRANEITLVVDLRSEDPRRRELEAKELNHAGLRYVSLPLYTSLPGGQTLDELNSPAKVAETRAAVTDVFEALRQGRRVYVHCARGEDRTGMFVALLRLHGLRSCGWEREFRMYGGDMYLPLNDLMQKARG